MNSYEHYGVEDFLCDDSFIEWVLNPGAPDEAFWNDWVQSNPGRAHIVSRARDIISSLAVKPLQEELSSREVSSIVAYVRQHGFEAALEKKATVPLYKKYAFGAVAAVLVLVFTGIYLYRNDRGTQPVKTAVVTVDTLSGYTNSSGVARIIRMSDSSLAILQPHSKLLYPPSFAGLKREVFLEGEAFFEIHKNASQPFLVHSQDMVTEVLGTSFTIRSFAADRQFKVIVNTGKVLVYRESDSGKSAPVAVVPNQEVVFEREQSTFKKDTLETPLPLSKAVASKKFSFYEAPVADIIRSLEEAYHVHIQYDEPRLGNLTLTASLSNLPLDEKIKLICKAINAQCDFRNGQIVITDNSSNTR